jgi:hypothetical protein
MIVCWLHRARAACAVLQAQSEVKKLETRLNTNLLKRLQELQNAPNALDLPTDRWVVGYACVSACLARLLL